MSSRRSILVKRVAAALFLGIFAVQVIPSLADVINGESQSESAPSPTPLVTVSPEPSVAPDGETATPTSPASPEPTATIIYSDVETATPAPTYAPTQNVKIRIPGKFPVDPRATSVHISPIAISGGEILLVCLSVDNAILQLAGGNEDLLIEGNGTKSLRISGDGAAVNAILSGRLLRTVPPSARIAIFWTVLLALLGALYLTPPRGGLLLTATAIGATGGASIAAIGAGWWLAPGALLAGLALAFPLWSWRRLHAASVGLMAQAARLEADDPSPAGGGSSQRFLEPIAQRLHRLENAGDRIRELNHHLGDTLESLRAAQREREQTLRFLSHDLRSPHLAILSLLESRTDGALGAEDAQRIERHSRRALELTDGFMQLARAESQPLRLSPHDLLDLITEAADACWQRSTQRGLRIETPAPDRAPTPPVCLCDAQLLRRALVNLLDNALRFGPPGSTVDIGLDRIGSFWRLTVCDRGPGIDPADRGRIFEPWWRGTQPDAGGGAGLGLAFVAAVMERHRGRATASGRDGGGAQIEIWLPDDPDAHLALH